jgi:Domain of unknown function (DUF4440)
MEYPRSLLCVVLLIGSGATLALAQTTSPRSGSKPEDQVLQLERDWLAADGSGDSARLRHIISDDFIGSSFDGGVLHKTDIIPENPGPGGFAGATASETNVRIFGDTGVLMGLINPVGGSAVKIRVLLVCQKRPEGWQMIAAQLTQIH